MSSAPVPGFFSGQYTGVPPGGGEDMGCMVNIIVVDGKW